MKKVINGKTYNTATATRIADWDNGHFGGDFKACEESLYLSPKGTFFLAGSGGPLSKYASSTGNGRSAGDGMEVLSELSAMQWCETHDVDTDTIAKYFEVEEG
jgi:hypothetical protein